MFYNYITNYREISLVVIKKNISHISRYYIMMEVKKVVSYSFYDLTVNYYFN
jgi:hypothetical protein